MTVRKDKQKQLAIATVLIHFSKACTAFEYFFETLINGCNCPFAKSTVL